MNPKYTTICQQCGERIDLLSVDNAVYWQSLPSCCQRHVYHRTEAQDNARDRDYRMAKSQCGSRIG